MNRLFAGVAILSSGLLTAQPGPPSRGPRDARPEPKAEDPGSISGRILSTAGEPLRKANVLISADGRGGRRFGAASDASGQFNVTGLEPGRYRIFAEKGGYVQQEYGARIAGRQGSPVTVSAGQSVKNIEIKLSPHAVVTGRILDDDGEPLVHATVQLRKRSWDRGQVQWVRAGGGTTNDLGEYRIFGVAPGRYVLEANGPDRNLSPGPGRRGPSTPAEQALAVTYFPGVPDAQSAAIIEVTSGVSLQGMDVQMRRVRTYRVRGVVSGLPDGGRNRGGGVMLRPRGGEAYEPNHYFAPLRDGEGNFEIRGVPPGSYLLMADMGGPGQTRLSARVPVDVGSADVDNVAVQLSPGFEVKGTVKIEGTAPVAFEGVSVILEPQPGSSGGFGGSRGGQVKADGSFAVGGVRPDRFAVRVYGLKGDLYVKSARIGQADALERGLDLTSGAAGTIDLVVSSGAARVEGTVTDSKSQPSAGARVLLHPGADHPRAAELAKTMSADQTGHYGFAGVTPGKYYLFAVEDFEPGAETDPDFVKKFQPAAETVELREGAVETKALKLADPR